MTPTLKRVTTSMALILMLSLNVACISNFNIVSPAAMDVGKRIKQAIKDAKQADGAKAKATIFAKAYCDLRARHPIAIEKIRSRLELVIPTIAVKATKALISKGCDNLTSTWQWHAPGLNINPTSTLSLAGVL